MAWPVRLTEDVYGVTDLREVLPQVVDKAAETKRPMIITKHSRPVAAIIDIEELQRLYDRLDELEGLEDQRVILEFQAAEKGGEVGWLSNAEMATFVDGLIAEAEKRA
jgi:prevent-host-death family protein